MDKKVQTTSAPQIFFFDHKTYQNLLQGSFSMQIRGCLEERRPILTNGMIDACIACQSMARRTSFNQSIARGFFRLASRHSTSGLHTIAELKIANQSA